MSKVGKLRHFSHRWRNKIRSRMEGRDVYGVTYLSGVRDILCELSLLNIWYLQNVNSDILQFIKQRLYDQEKQRILCNISNMKKCFLYKHIIDKISLQHYLKKCIPKKCVKYITMLRLSAHYLSMETGRYQGINTVNRLCQFCKSDVEDEFHLVLKCPVYDCFRKLYIKSIIEPNHPFSNLYSYYALGILKIYVILVLFL